MRDEYDLKKLKRSNHPELLAKAKKAVGINLHHEVINYFKQLSIKHQIPYQTLINMYLLDCAKKKKEPETEWIKQA